MKFSIAPSAYNVQKCNGPVKYRNIPKKPWQGKIFLRKKCTMFAIKETKLKNTIQ